MASTYNIAQIVVVAVIFFFFGGMTTVALLNAALRGRINIRVFFEVIPESQYDEYRYRGETKIGE